MDKIKATEDTMVDLLKLKFEEDVIKLFRDFERERK